MISIKHPIADFTLYFDEAKHQYLIDIEKSQEYWQKVPSVTQFVGHYTPTFDADKIAAITAKKQGKTADAVKAEWEAKKNAACEMGTRVHANQEKHLKGLTNYEQPQDDRERQIMAYGWKAIEDMLSAGFKPIDAEKMVFSLSFKLAGTIDALMQKGRVIYIIDWKTNGEIKAHNEYHQFMLPPAESLEDCALNHYSLQLNLYERILKRDFYIPQIQEVKKMLVHLQPTQYKIIPIDDNPIADKLLLDYLACDWYDINNTMPKELQI